METSAHRFNLVKVTARVGKKDLRLLQKITRKKPSQLVRELISEKARALRKKDEAGPHNVMKLFGVSKISDEWDRVLDEIYREREANYGREFPA